MNELVFKGHNDQVLTSSLLVAEKFGKEHQHVLRDIRALIEGLSKSGDTPMFAETTYIHEQNKQEYPMFVMNRDGFTLLAMGFNGNKALGFKLEYIKAFNEMEKRLKEQQKPLSQLEILVQSAQALLEQSQRLSVVEQRLDEMEADRIIKTEMLLSAPISNEPTPDLSLRDNIRQLVNKYSAATGVKQQDVWHKVYNQLYYLYHINVKAYKKHKKNETYLEVAERNLLLDKIYIIISNLVRELPTQS